MQKLCCSDFSFVLFVLKKAEKEIKRALKKAEIEAKRAKRTQKAEKEALKKAKEEFEAEEAENYN